MNQPPTNAVAAHNLTILEETKECDLVLPSMFAVRHSPNSSNDFAAIVHCTPSPNWNSNSHIWNMGLIEEPKEFLGVSMMIEHPTQWTHLNSNSPFLVERFSCRPEENKKIYKTTVKYTGFAIRQADGNAIPLLELNKARLVLSSRFTHLDGPQGIRFRFMLRMGLNIEPDSVTRLRELRQQAINMAELEAAGLLIRMNAQNSRREITVLPPRANKMPQHIVNQYIEALVGKQESCPITMAPLDKESACLTPCGHALDSSSAKHWISNEHSCPVCRQGCSEEDLQVWTA